MMPNAITSTTDAPLLCKDDSSCLSDAFTFGREASWSTTTNFGGEIGLAKDGHVIVGPYNADGELWDCSEYDVCNGTFISDGSYVYVASAKFPYTVGCWGPGADLTSGVATSCSSKGCTGDGTTGSMSGLSVLAGAIASLVVSLSF